MIVETEFHWVSPLALLLVEMAVPEDGPSNVFSWVAVTGTAPRCQVAAPATASARQSYRWRCRTSPPTSPYCWTTENQQERLYVNGNKEMLSSRIYSRIASMTPPKF